MHNIILYLLIVLIPSFSFAQDQFDNLLIEKIDITLMNQAEGVQSDTNAIVARMKSHEGGLFSQDDFDSDLKTLVQDFDRIEPVLTTSDNRIFISLKIWPKPTIRTITWIGNEKIEISRLQKELGIASCSLFDRRAFNQAFHKLKTLYIKDSFFEAELNYQVIPDIDSNQVDIQITINEGRAGWIKAIQFVNFTPDEEAELLDMMVTKEYFFLTSWFTEEGTYREEAVQQDEFTILNYLQNKGYADAEVHIEVQEAQESNRIMLVVTANKGQIYTVGKINIQGNSVFAIDEIWRRLDLCEGNIYSPERIRECTNRIISLYGKHGYIDAFVEHEPRLCPDQECVYDLDLTIIEGEQYRVGLIKVLGNCSTHTEVILHEVLLVPGEVFNLDKLRKTEEKLSNIGYFKTVNVYAVKMDEECSLGGNYRDVHVEVEETSTGRFGAFAGFSTVENLFAGINISENNFNFKGFGSIFTRGLCALRGGGEYAYFTMQVGARSSSYVLSWSKPWFLDTAWIVGFDLEKSSNRYVSSDYNIKTSGLKIHGLYEINAFLKAGMHYRIKYSHIHLDEDNPSPELVRQIKNSGFLSAFGVSWVYDSTNHPVKPTEGFKSRLLTEFAGSKNEHLFLNFGYLNTYFFKVPEIDCKGVWSFRCDLRFIQPLARTKPTDIPLEERFFLGGEETVRGFKSYRLGPKFPANPGSDDDHKDPMGGISMQYLSLEYTRPLVNRIDGFLFADAGHLSMHRWNFGKIYTSVGFGLKLTLFEATPPLVLGLGFPLNARHGKDIKRFFLSIGGHF